MNKGLEFIEACWLFDVPPAMVDVVVHPQSVIHSMVAYRDGSVLAQMGTPDMRTPHRLRSVMAGAGGIRGQAAGFCGVGRAGFLNCPDLKRFPCLGLARDAMAAGGTATAVLNAANEEAVAGFSKRSARFYGHCGCGGANPGATGCAQPAGMWMRSWRLIARRGRLPAAGLRSVDADVAGIRRHDCDHCGFPEWGHFLAMRAFGVRVLTFSVGFGPENPAFH